MPTDTAAMTDEMPRDALDGLVIETVFFDDRGAEARRRTRPLRALLARKPQVYADCGPAAL